MESNSSAGGTGVIPHRWHVRGGIVGWGYRYLLIQSGRAAAIEEPRLQQWCGGRDLGDGPGPPLSGTER